MAATQYGSVIEQLYVAYFSRPADMPGLLYWTAALEANHGDARPVAAAFAASAEYKNFTGTLDAYHLVGAAYQNLFGHAPDVPGLTYWAQGLISGAGTVAGFMDALAHGAQGSDLAVFNNKVSAAIAFSAEMTGPETILGYSGDAANSGARAFLHSIDSDASLAAALLPQAMHNVLMSVTGYCGGPYGNAVATVAADAIVLVGQAPAPGHA